SSQNSGFAGAQWFVRLIDVKSKLNLLQDPVDLTAALVDIESVSHNETAIADAVEAALREVAQADESIEVLRIDNNVIARTHRG
ncbi:hypothetical protein QP391_09715, partial [Lactobacillus paragasseri]|nr:hypothetical protein [Lactobacillus paragasseri]